MKGPKFLGIAVKSFGNPSLNFIPTSDLNASWGLEKQYIIRVGGGFINVAVLLRIFVNSDV